MIRDGGLGAIQMGTIAKQMGLTRGTLYNHFANREEIVLCLAARAIRRRLALFQFAIDRFERPRDQIAAVGLACEVYVDKMPDDFAVEQMVRHDSVLLKTSAIHRDQLHRDEKECMELVGGVVQQAVRAGDLVLDDEDSAQNVLFGLWSLIYGGLTLEATSPSLAQVGIESPRIAIRRNCNAMLDGIRWQPLLDPARYQSFAIATKRQIDAQAKHIIDEDHQAGQIDDAVGPGENFTEPASRVAVSNATASTGVAS